jgi:hypothetical protein
MHTTSAFTPWLKWARVRTAIKEEIYGFFRRIVKARAHRSLGNRQVAQTIR